MNIIRFKNLNKMKKSHKKLTYIKNHLPIYNQWIKIKFWYLINLKFAKLKKVIIIIISVFYNNIFIKSNIFKEKWIINQLLIMILLIIC